MERGGKYVSQARQFFSNDLRHSKGVAKSCHRGKVHCVKWNNSGSRLATVSTDTIAALWTVRSDSAVPMQKELEFTEHSDVIDQCRWKAGSDQLLSTASRDGTVKFWDVRAGSKSVATTKTAGENLSLAWSPNGNEVAVGNQNDVISFIDTRKYEVVNKKSCNMLVNEIDWNHAGDLFLLTTGDGFISVLDYPSLDESMSPLRAHTGCTYCLEFDSKERYFATGGADALVGLWHATEMVCLRTIGEAEWPIRAMSFSFDGRLLATASEDTFICINYVDTGELVHKINTAEGTTAVAWHPSQLLLAFSGEGKSTGYVSVFG
mmetsp:Transcript_16857/g.43849  ORF Transcript_16857/g.43849 Transcript_16857/m.43849 type:complete len:320 (+) Transcript_16857:332-1291(+)